MKENLVVNNGKAALVEVEGKTYQRLAIKTHVVTKDDDLKEVINTYAAPNLKNGDVLFISEKMVACTQSRAIPIKEIKASWLAKLLSKFVVKTPHGIGLGMPETMEMALRECGVLKILFASFCGMIGKVLGKRGWFYNVAGDKARSIDGPCPNTLPPYNQYVVLGPQDPEKVALELSEMLKGIPVLIVDINDLGGNILSSSLGHETDKYYLKFLSDNPLGQSKEQTPMGIIREVNVEDSKNIND